MENQTNVLETIWKEIEAAPLGGKIDLDSAKIDNVDPKRGDVQFSLWSGQKFILTLTEL